MATESEKPKLPETMSAERSAAIKLVEGLMATVENETRDDATLLGVFHGAIEGASETEKEQIREMAEGVLGEKLEGLKGDTEREWLEEVTKPGAEPEKVIADAGGVFAEGFQKLVDEFGLDASKPEEIVQAAKVVRELVGEKSTIKVTPPVETAPVVETEVKVGEEKALVGVATEPGDEDVLEGEVVEEVIEAKPVEPKTEEVVVETPEVEEPKEEEKPVTEEVKTKEEERDWQGEYETLKAFGPDVVGKWVADNIRDLPTEMRDMVKSDIAAVPKAPSPAESMFRTKEIEMTDERNAQARKILIDLIEGTEGGLGVESGLAALEGRIAKLAEEWGGFISETVMEEFRKELRARINLKQVSDFWAQVTEYSDKDQMRVGLKERISTAPILTKETYKWLVETEDLLIMVEGRVEKENLRGEVDSALQLIWQEMMKKDGIGYRDPRGMLGIYEKYYGPLKEGEAARSYKQVHKDTFMLAWRLAEAEMWIVERGGKPTLHPAARVINFAGIRWSKRDLSGSATYGGRRLYFEHRAKKGVEKIADDFALEKGMSIFELSDKELAENPYQAEGRGFAGTGLFFVGEDRHAVRKAVRDGRYLQYLKEQWTERNEEGEEIGSKPFSPQEKAMKSLLDAGIKVFEVMKEMVGGEAKYVSAEKVGALVPWIFMVDENVWRNVGENKDERINRMFIEAAKTLIWGASLANEDNIVDPTGMNKMLPLGELNKILYGLVASVDPRDRQAGTYIGRRSVDLETNQTKARKNLEANKKDVKEIVDWYGRLVMGLRHEIYTSNPLKVFSEVLRMGEDKYRYLRDGGQLDMFMKGYLDFKQRQYYSSRGLGMFG